MSQLKKAAALISGGLDSLLATKIILEQGIYVEGINFYTGFCIEDLKNTIRRNQSPSLKRNRALLVAEQLGIQLNFVDISESYKNIVLNPRYGYGTNLNPCLDCKCFMIKTALSWIRENNFDFIITGEVIGQRPMSQRKSSLLLINRESGANDLLVRPLSAKILPPTLPEREGWIDRERLYDFTGRSRKPQIALAANYQINNYAQPAGGCCFLTDYSYSAKLTDLWKCRGQRDYSLDDILLLKIGHHLRPRPYFKLIIGREEGENNFLLGYRNEFIYLNIISHLGPIILIDGVLKDDTDCELIARIAGRFSQGKNAQKVEIELIQRDGSSKRLITTPLSSEDIPKEWYIGNTS